MLSDEVWYLKEKKPYREIFFKIPKCATSHIKRVDYKNKKFPIGKFYKTSQCALYAF